MRRHGKNKGEKRNGWRIFPASKDISALMPVPKQVLMVTWVCIPVGPLISGWPWACQATAPASVFLFLKTDNDSTYLI